MAWKRHRDEDCLKLLRETELQLASGANVSGACRSVGTSDPTYYAWRQAAVAKTADKAGAIPSV